MNFKYILGVFLFFPVLPLMYYQAKKIKKSVPNLPEAEGAEGQSTNHSTTQKTVRMLAIGESTIAGVGVQTHQEGFTGALADALSQSFNVNILWKVYAKSGYTAKNIIQDIIPKITETEIDLIVIGIGANDAFKLNIPRKWKREIRALVFSLQERFPKSPIVFCNMPPIKEFPAFTPLIKASIGNLVEILGEELKEVIKELDNVYYKSEIITIKNWNKKSGLNHHVSYYFSDGLHPSRFAYQAWAHDLANTIVQEKELRNAVLKIV